MPPEAMAPIASSSCPGTPSLRTRKASSGAPQRLGDFVRHGNAAARQAEHDDIGPVGIGQQS